MHHELVTSEFILEELGRKLLDKFHFPKREINQVTAFLRRASLIVVPAVLPATVCRDSTDLPILGTAVAGNCSLLISVDRDLLDMKKIDDIRIIRPGEYWRRTNQNG